MCRQCGARPVAGRRGVYVCANPQVVAGAHGKRWTNSGTKEVQRNPAGIWVVYRSARQAGQKRSRNQVRVAVGITYQVSNQWGVA